jgi:hypothetical protein
MSGLNLAFLAWRGLFQAQSKVGKFQAITALCLATRYRQNSFSYNHYRRLAFGLAGFAFSR